VVVIVPLVGIIILCGSVGEDEDEKLARLLSLAVANDETNFIFLPGKEYGWLVIGRRRASQAAAVLLVDVAITIAIVNVGLRTVSGLLAGSGRG
jgi:hypothetical protein